MASIPTSVALFGAIGNLGSSIISALIGTGKYKVTAVVRHESRTTLLPAVHVVKGDLHSSHFLEESLKYQDVVIIAFGIEAPQSLDKAIVHAAAEVGVKYILPNEFVSQDSLRRHFPFGLHDKKNEIRDLIQKLGKSKWIAIVNGTWYDFSLLTGSYGIDIRNRKAVIWTPTTAKANVTTLAKVGKAIAALLGLGEEQLKQYANACVYISSFRLSQSDIFRSVQRATGTQTADWNITYNNVHKAIQEGQNTASKGDVKGFIKVIYAMQFLPGAGGDYEITNGVLNETLKLEDEDLDTVTKTVIPQI
nr:hypothetical protein CFP56_11681 [Quercus suber]